VAFVEVVVVSGHIAGCDQVPYLLYDLLFGHRLCRLYFLLCSFVHCCCRVCYFIGFTSFIGFEDLSCILPSFVAIALGVDTVK